MACESRINISALMKLSRIELKDQQAPLQHNHMKCGSLESRSLALVDFGSTAA